MIIMYDRIHAIIFDEVDVEHKVKMKCKVKMDHNVKTKQIFYLKCELSTTNSTRHKRPPTVGHVSSHRFARPVTSTTSLATRPYRLRNQVYCL